MKDFLHCHKISSVVVGLSGGPDSVALADILTKCGTKIHAVHCNFNLRGEESLRDKNYVSSFCMERNIPLSIFNFDTGKYAEDNHLSIEMACRELRYREFRKIKEHLQYDRIAVAHHADDNIETLLLNLFRGTGISGLRGMLPDTGEIIRPLLTITRDQIISYLVSENISYVIDSTNKESDYRRNFLRNEIIPLLETRWPSLKKNLSQNIEILREQETVINKALESVATPGDDILYFDDIASFPSPSTLVHHFLKDTGASPEVEREVLRLALYGRDKGGRKWSASNTDIYSTNQYIYIERIDRAENENGRIIDGESPDFNQLFNCEVLEYSDDLMKKIKSDRSNGTFYSPLPPSEYIFRFPTPGDRMTPLGMRGSKLLNDILRDSGIPRPIRSRLRLAVHKETGKIVWLQSVKRSSCFPIRKDSKVFIITPVDTRK